MKEFENKTLLITGSTGSFGNAVLDSNFKEGRILSRDEKMQDDQMRAHKPITITDPNMTRFMMALNDAIDRVIYAFLQGQNGDLFVQKAPAATLHVLSQAFKELYHSDAEVKVISIRHGENLYETLVTREEMDKAVNLGDHFRIPCDTRDLNYDKFFIEGQNEISTIDDYHSHNTHLLYVEWMNNLLLKLDMIQKDLAL